MTWLLLLLACRGGKDDPVGDDSAPGETADTAPTWLALSDDCAAPDALPDDPLTRTGMASFPQVAGGPFLEAIDVAIAGDLIYAVGQGGLVIVDASDLSEPVGVYGPWEASRGKLHRVVAAGDGLLVTSHRDQGAWVWDVADPAAAEVIGEIPGIGIEGLAWDQDRLYLTVRDEGIRGYSLDDPTSPALVGATSGLDAPWVLAATGDGWLYAADAALGVVPIDVTDPSAPVVGDPVALDGAVQHVHYADDRLYAATGGDGVVVLDVSDRGAPAVVATVETGGSAVASAVADGRLWVVDHEGVTLFDLTMDPPAPLQREVTDQFALAVAADGEHAVVGDWNDLEIWTFDPSLEAGALDTPSSTLRVRGGEARATLTNRGSGTLSLVGAAAADSAVTVEVTATALGQGEAAELRLTGLTDDTTLCLASDDPDEPVMTLDVINSAPAPAGVPAPDFALVGLDGETRRLSEQLGHPVLLVYFATW